MAVRRPMEKSSSQGSRTQARRAVSCSGHTTRRAQKLSRRDTWGMSEDSGWRVPPRYPQIQGNASPGSWVFPFHTRSELGVSQTHPSQHLLQMPKVHPYLLVFLVPYSQEGPSETGSERGSRLNIPGSLPRVSEDWQRLPGLSFLCFRISRRTHSKGAIPY